ncbi:DUF1573 domain-containing protein [Candidatus Uhrbacteria bacterium]|nr:DUF1573 domain-containing protein [Candidatus Uhrbacteria bacterium]
MKKKSHLILYGLLGFIVLLIGIQVASSSSSSPQAEAVGSGSLRVSEQRWNIGDVPMSGGISTKQITLTNDSSAPVEITNLQTSCMCTTAQLVHADGSKSGLKGMVGHGGSSSLSETIAPGEEAQLLVRFDPNAHGPSGVGPITRDVVLETNSASQSKITLTFTGNVIK